MSVSRMETGVALREIESLPIAHGVLLTFGPLGQHRLLIAPMATANFANLFVYVYREG